MSGIKCWEEDVQHLKLQMQKDQPSSCDSWYLRQQKREDRKYVEKCRAEKAVKRLDEVIPNIEDQEEVLLDEHLDEDDDKNDGDVNFNVSKKRRKVLDVLGPVSLTADRLGLSVRDRTMIAASVCQAVGINVMVRKHYMRQSLKAGNS